MARESITPDIARAAVNEASQNARNVYIVFVLVGVYVAMIVGSTTDEMLLREAPIHLPVFEVGIPIVGAYAIIPVIFLLLHLNLLVQLRLLANKLRAYREILDTEVPAESERAGHRGLIFPFGFSMIFMRDGRPGPFDVLLIAMMWLSVVVLPVLLLIWTQIWFLRYQSVAITTVHQATIVIDLALLWYLWSIQIKPHSIWRRSLDHCFAFATVAVVTLYTLFDAIPPRHPLNGRASSISLAAAGVNNMTDAFIYRRFLDLRKKGWSVIKRWFNSWRAVPPAIKFASIVSTWRKASAWIFATEA